MDPLSIALIYNVAASWESADVDAVLEGVASIRTSLEDLGHRVVPLRVSEGVLPLVTGLESMKPDVVFNLCEGYHDHSTGEASIAALLELLGLPYTGSGPVALALALDKPLAKQLFTGAGIRTPAFAVYRPGSDISVQLAYPVILKLACEDASLGITSDNLVRDDQAFARRLQELLAEHGTTVMAEEFIDGREFTVAMLDGEPIALEEIVFSIEPRILCFRAKWRPGSREDLAADPVFAPAISDRERSEMYDLASRVHALIGIRDYGRIDFRMDALGRIHVLEANPNPDITSNSGYRESLEAANIPYPAFLTRLLANALRRGGRVFTKN
jgi:D-alanine-D-alanine ligase